MANETKKPVRKAPGIRPVSNRPQVKVTTEEKPKVAPKTGGK